MNDVRKSQSGPSLGRFHGNHWQVGYQVLGQCLFNFLHNIWSNMTQIEANAIWGRRPRFETSTNNSKRIRNMKPKIKKKTARKMSIGRSDTCQCVTIKPNLPKIVTCEPSSIIVKKATGNRLQGRITRRRS